MDLHFPTINVNQEPTMTPNESPSPIPASISDKGRDRSSKSDSSSTQWWWPENQLGLEQEHRFGPQGVALDEKGEIINKHYDEIMKY